MREILLDLHNWIVACLICVLVCVIVFNVSKNILPSLRVLSAQCGVALVLIALVLAFIGKSNEETRLREAQRVAHAAEAASYQGR